MNRRLPIAWLVGGVSIIQWFVVCPKASGGELGLDTLIIPSSFSQVEAEGASSTLRDVIRMQEIYGSAYFTNGPVWIHELRFRPSALYGGSFSATIADLELRLSTSTKPAHQLGLDFSGNIGADEATVFAGSLALSSDFLGPAAGPKAFDIRIPFDAPFYFDPSQGNLLIDLMNRSGSVATLVNAGLVPNNLGSRIFQVNGGGTVHGDAGADVLELAFVLPDAAPAISREPEDVVALVGDHVSLRSAASGSFPLDYQWMFGDMILPQATNAILTLSDLQLEDAGGYWVRVANEFGAATSRVAVVTVTNYLRSVLPDVYADVEAGGNSTTWREGKRVQQVYAAASLGLEPMIVRQLRFRPSAASGRPFQVPVSGLTVRLSTTTAQPDALSEVFADNSGPDDTTVFAGEILLSSTWSGPIEGPMDFDMILPLTVPFPYDPAEGPLLVDMVHAAASTASIIDASMAADDGASRAVAVGNESLEAGIRDTMADVMQVIHSDPNDLEELTVVLAPSDQTILAGNPARFQVVALGPWPIHYQWRYQGEELLGATNRFLILPDAQPHQSGAYVVVVSNAVGMLVTEPAELVVEVPPPAVVVRGPYLQKPTQGSMTVQWRTDVPVPGAVRFGLAADLLDQSVAELDSGIDHRVELTELQPDTRYFYAVLSGTNILSGGEDHFFTTPPAQAKPTRIWAIGDCGTASQGSSIPRAVFQAYRQFTGERATDVWLMLGDNAYYSGTDAEYQAAVFDVFQPLLRQVPLWSTIGNHETYAGDAQGHIAYLDIFTLPRNGEAGGNPSGTERYYSFDYANIHFVCLDSETSDKQPSGAMMTWLAEDLAANTNDWLIAFWHSPPYSKGSHNSDFEGNLVQMRQWAVPILEDHGVDLVLCGHSHCYERSYPVLGHYGTSDMLIPEMFKYHTSGREEESGAYLPYQTGSLYHQGAIYIVAGNAGQASGGPLNHPVMFTSLNRLGSLVIDVDRLRLDARFLRENGAVDDWFTVLKDPAQARLRLAGIRVADGVVTADWISTPGAVYRIEKSDDLDSPQWTSISGNIVAESANSTWTGPVADGGQDRAFYRVARISP